MLPGRQTATPDLALHADEHTPMNHLDAARIMAADCLCFRARRTARAITRLYDAALRPTGLQATQVTLMNAIALGPGGAQPMSTLADVLAIELSTLTRNLKALDKEGLVEIARSPADGRVRLARLTGAGKRRLAKALPHWRRAHAAVIATLGEQTAGSLHEALDAAATAIGAPGSGT